MKADIYQHIMDQIVCELEKGAWLKPRNAKHAAGRITRPLGGNGIPYRGIKHLATDEPHMELGIRLRKFPN
jgi:antirestriction protein ArdC